VPRPESTSVSGPSGRRVAEAVEAPYGAVPSADLSSAADAELLAELRRRLEEPGRRVGADQILNADRSRIADICRRHGIVRLALFGSVLRADFRPESDVDVLAEFAPGRTPGLGMIAIQDELAALFGGRRVSLVTPKGLHPLVRENVLAEARSLYGA
jgi:hypothetical protein